MSYRPLHEDFDCVAARRRHEVLSADIPAGLGVNRSFLRWAPSWDDLLKQPPSVFYQTLARNMPGELSVFVDFSGACDAEITCSLKQNGRFVFESENKVVRDGQGKKLRFEEWVVKEPEHRCHGIGLNLLMNFVSMAQASGFDSISLRAGKEDGKYFWARHGFYLKDVGYRDLMGQDIRKNLEEYSDTIRPEIFKEVSNWIDEGSLDLCWRVARLPGNIGGKPLGWVLLQGYNPEFLMDLRNDGQMARVYESFERRRRPAPVHNPAAP